MPKGQRLTTEEVNQLKAIIRTGEPIVSISERLAAQYNRPEESFRMTLYNLAKRTYKIAEWNGPKRRRKKNTTTPAAPETAVMETPRTPTQKIARVERYDDHIRIYF
jgi:hypothetical protein